MELELNWNGMEQCHELFNGSHISLYRLICDVIFSCPVTHICLHLLTSKLFSMSYRTRKIKHISNKYLKRRIWYVQFPFHSYSIPCFTK